MRGTSPRPVHLLVGLYMNWIATKHKNPPFDTPVLVYCEVYGRFIATFFEIDDTGYGNWSNDVERGILPPTHWMPLPDVPN